MSKQIKNFIAVLGLAVLITSAPSLYAVQVADWEGVADNAIDWGNKLPVTDPSNAAIYQFDTSVGVTSGSQSLHVNQAGYTQSLALRLDTAGRAAFMANSIFSIDVSVAASGGDYTAGYTNIEQVAMNAPGPGFVAVTGDTPLQFYWWGTAGARTQTLVIDYSAFRQQITTTEYIEIVFAMNTGSGAPDDIYFDNARFTGGTGALGSYPDEVMLDNPVLYLRLEADTPTNTSSGNGVQIDSSSNNYWAAHRANTQFRSNEGIGNCRYFPATGNQNSIAAANAAAFPGWTFDFSDTYAFAPDDITFEFWFNSDANDMSPYAIFFQQVKTDYGKAPGLGNSSGTFRVLNGNPTDTDTATEHWWYTNVPVPLDGRWHQVVLTYRESYGTADEMAIGFYLDAEPVASTIVGDATWPAGLGPELDHVLIGGANDMGYTWNNYKGLIDEFAIYAGVLPADRIAVHYAAGLCAMSKGDVTGDCKVDMQDFAVVAGTWLDCNDPALFGSDPACGPTW